MFVVGFHGTEVNAQHWIVEAIQRDHLGGVILFDRNVDKSIQNIGSSEQLQLLVHTLQGCADVPLFISVDQEGGKVCRLKSRDGFAPSSSAADLAAKGVDATAQEADGMAAQLAAHGINLNFAPVVDLELNPENPIISGYQRSFGADPRIVAEHAAAFIAAHHRHGVGCCLKHFPGHGSAGSDSHLGFVDITERWSPLELEPYRRLVASGYSDGIMTAHLVHQALDPHGVPATLSNPMITGMLRTQLQFGGVVFSDDLQMRAISQGWSYQEAVQRAVLAGVDVLVVGNNLTPCVDAVRRGIEAIGELLDTGRIDENHIEATLQRIQLFKDKISGKLPWQCIDQHIAD